jgi:hypothetical protein
VAGRDRFTEHPVLRHQHPPRAAAKLDDELFGEISEEARRLEQPRARYEDKRQLLLDFSESILGSMAPGGSRGGQNERRFAGLQIIRERLAADLVADTPVDLLGETVPSSEDFAVKALALQRECFVGLC